MKKIVSILLLAASSILAASAQNVATFEGLPFDTTAQWWIGAAKGGDTTFQSGDYRFANNKNLEYQSWSGFAYSKVKASDYDPEIGLDNQYRNVTGYGVDGSENFAIGYYSSYTGKSVISAADTKAGVQVKGAYFTNIATTYEAITNGDNYVKAFDSGDFYKVIFTGMFQGDTTQVMEIYLADYRDADSNNHYVLNTWEWFDLSPLGNIDTILVSTLSSQIGQWGDNLASYFAIDNFGSEAPIDTMPTVVKLQPGQDTSFTFDFLFEIPAKGQYFASIIDSTDASVASMTMGDTTLDIKAVKEGKTSFTVKGIRNGRIVYTCINIEVSKEEETANAANQQAMEVKVYPVPAQNEINVVAEGNYNLEIFDLSGKRLYFRNGLSNTTTIGLDNYKSGMYIIRIANQDGVAVKRFIISR